LRRCCSEFIRPQDQEAIIATDGAFGELRPYAAALAELPCPWFVAGGWALDLYLGRVTREHADVDVALYRADQRALRRWLAAGGWSAERAADGRLEPWGEDEWLALPVHEIHCRRPAGEPGHLEFLLNEGDAAEWRFRKAPAITRPRSLVEMRSPEGIPFYAPEVVLLYKALARRRHDDADFAAARPSLAPERRAWLRGALASIDPSHPGLAVL